MQIEPLRIYTVSVASQLLRISERTLIELIKKGEINAKYIGRGWKILGDDLITYFKK